MSCKESKYAEAQLSWYLHMYDKKDEIPFTAEHLDLKGYEDEMFSKYITPATTFHLKFSCKTKDCNETRTLTKNEFLIPRPKDGVVTTPEEDIIEAITNDTKVTCTKCKSDMTYINMQKTGNPHHVPEKAIPIHINA